MKILLVDLGCSLSLVEEVLSELATLLTDLLLFSGLVLEAVFQNLLTILVG